MCPAAISSDHSGGTRGCRPTKYRQLLAETGLFFSGKMCYTFLLYFLDRSE